MIEPQSDGRAADFEPGCRGFVAIPQYSSGQFRRAPFHTAETKAVTEPFRVTSQKSLGFWARRASHFALVQGNTLKKRDLPYPCYRCAKMAIWSWHDFCQIGLVFREQG